MQPASLAAPRLIGRSPAFLQALQLIERMARFDAPVLIRAKPAPARNWRRAPSTTVPRAGTGPFVPVNCGALPETLIETELFGCERGAFTDARQARTGLVAAAEGGTLFLDELDALPLRAQVALLRFLQDQRYRPVGGARECSGNVRILAAASPRLDALLDGHHFRDDLVFRLNVLLLELPPLRERPGDAQLLAEHFLAEHQRRHALAPRRLTAASLDWMACHAWPGNVRELDNRVQRALMLSDGDTLELSPLRAGVDRGHTGQRGPWRAAQLP
ncbi:MAG: sigma 54-interacting transcriptional regulator [Pseudorhodoferax sp.]